MRNIYDDAILVQDACNPAGVARFLVKCIDHIHAESTYKGTDYVRRHPLFVLVVNKLDSLVEGVSIGSNACFPTAYGACKFRAEDHPSGDHDSLKSQALPGHPKPEKPMTVTHATAASLPRASTRYCWKNAGHKGRCDPDHDFPDVRGSCNGTG